MRNVVFFLGMVSVVGCVTSDDMAFYKETVKSNRETDESRRKFIAEMADEKQHIYDGKSDEELIEIAKKDLSLKLSDPDSATFQHVNFVTLLNHRAICGMYNAKNKFGGYTGYKPFHWMNGFVMTRDSVRIGGGRNYNLDSERMDICYLNELDFKGFSK